MVNILLLLGADLSASARGMNRLREKDTLTGNIFITSDTYIIWSESNTIGRGIISIPKYRESYHIQSEMLQALLISFRLFLLVLHSDKRLYERT